MFVGVSGGKKCSFFGKFGVLCFLETPVLIFALLPYYLRNSVFKSILLTNLFEVFHLVIIFFLFQSFCELCFLSNIWIFVDSLFVAFFYGFPGPIYHLALP